MDKNSCHNFIVPDDSARGVVSRRTLLHDREAVNSPARLGNCLAARAWARTFYLSLFLLVASPLCAQTQGDYYKMDTYAGSFDLGDGGPAAASRLYEPRGISVDLDGNILVADAEHHRIRRIDRAGVITTIAGTGLPGSAGDGGAATKAELNQPMHAIQAPDRSIYIADRTNYVIRRIAPNGIISTVAGVRRRGFSGDKGPALNAMLEGPEFLALDARGNLYFTELSAHRLRVIDGAGVISTLAGTGQPGSTGDGGPAAQARLNFPRGVAVTGTGVIYVYEGFTSPRIRRIDSPFAGNITTLVANAALSDSNGLALDGEGQLYLAAGRRLLKINPETREIFPLAGAVGVWAHAGDGGPARSATFVLPHGVAIDRDGSVLVTDRLAHRLRRITPAGVINTLAGRVPTNVVNAPSTGAVLMDPADIRPHPAGLLVVDRNNDCIQLVGLDQTVTTAVGRCGAFTSRSPYPSNGGAATDALLNVPSSVVADKAGNIYFFLALSPRLYRVDNRSRVLASSIPFTGRSIPVAVTSMAFTPDEKSIYMNAYGRIWIVDVATGAASLFAGQASSANDGFGGDGGPAAAAKLSSSLMVAVDSRGDVYIADTENHRIRRVRAGIIETVAGNGSSNPPVSGALAAQSPIGSPESIAISRNGDLFIGSSTTLSRIDAVTGRIHVLAGQGKPGWEGDGGLGTLGFMRATAGLEILPDGSLVSGDPLGHVVRRFSPVKFAGLEIVGGNGQSGLAGSAAAEPLAVRILSDVPRLPGVAVDFAVTSGSATLSAARVTTDDQGVARVQVRFGATTEPIVVAATALGLPAVTFRLIPQAAPVLTSLSRSEGPLTAAIPPGAPITLRGTGFYPAGEPERVADAQEDGLLPTSLAGVCVLFGETRAPIVRLSSSQVVALVPTLPEGAISVLLSLNCGLPNELRSNALELSISPLEPELLIGQLADDARLFARFLNEGRQMAALGSAIKAGAVVTLLGTGFGATDPAVAPGTVLSQRAPLAASVVVKINGEAVPAEAVTFCGLGLHAPGVYECDVILPDSLAPGEYSVELIIEERSSGTDAMLLVEP